MSTNSRFYGEDPKFGIGVVEDIRDPLKAGRVRVRIFGIHSPFTDELPTTDLPWSQVSMPVTSASISGEGDTPQLLVGSQVFGLFLDGDSYQQFLVIGSMLGFEGRTTVQAGTNQANFDLDSPSEPSTPQPSRLVGNSNAEKAFQFFIQYGGYSEDQSAGMVGSLVSLSNESLDPKQTGGIAKWTGSRLKALKSYAFQSSLSYQDLAIQLSFIVNELQSSYISTAKKLVNTNLPSTAAEIFSKGYLNKTATDRVKTLANQAKAAFGSTIGDDPGKFTISTTSKTVYSKGEIVETDEELLNIFKSGKKKRQITELILHDTDTYEDEQVTVFDIDKTHKDFGGVQFHFLIQRNGNLQVGRDLALPETSIANIDVEKIATTISENGKNLIKSFEGLRLTAYEDPVGSGRYAIGYGFNDGTIQEGDTITQEEADRLFDSSITEFETSLNAALNGTPINQNQFDAYMSLSYNIGSGAFASSISLKRFRAGKIKEAADAILNFNKVTIDGVKVFNQSLATRRNAERNLFLTPVGTLDKQTVTRLNNTISLAIAGGRIGTIVQRGNNKGATYTQKQYDTLDSFIKNFLFVWQDSNVLGHNDIDSRSLDPYFDVTSYVEDKFNHENKKDAASSPVIPDRQVKTSSPDIDQDIIEEPGSSTPVTLAEASEEDSITVIEANGTSEVDIPGFIFNLSKYALNSSLNDFITGIDNNSITNDKLDDMPAGTMKGSILGGDPQDLIPEEIRNLISVREVLPADRTYYVATTGSDTNDGLTISTPFLTIQKAVDTLSVINGGLHVGNIEVAAGTYAELVNLRALSGYSIVNINGASASTTIITGGAVNGNSATQGCFYAGSGVTGTYYINNFTFQPSTAVSVAWGVFMSDSFCTVQIGTIRVNRCRRAAFEVIGAGSTIRIIDGSTITDISTGSASQFIYAQQHGRVIWFNSTVAPDLVISGTPTYTQWCLCESHAYCRFVSFTFSVTGTVTGPRYLVRRLGLIDSNVGGASYLPGSTAGTEETSTSGHYV